jgi:hypothetical protein
MMMMMIDGGGGGGSGSCDNSDILNTVTISVEVCMYCNLL